MVDEIGKLDFHAIERTAQDAIKHEQERYDPRFAESELQKVAPYIAKGIAEAIKEYDRQKAK